MSRSVPAMWMRGGTSKGGFFLAADLPADQAERDAFLLAIYGSPDMRQIDGLGGGDPLTSKAAIVKPSHDANIDIDYLFLQIAVDQARVSASQNCGNMLAAVGPFALERQLVAPTPGTTEIAIRMVNSQQIAYASVCTPENRVSYAGDFALDGVPGSAAPISLRFADIAGATTGALLPTGQVCDHIDGIALTCIDNGMPVVLLHAEALGVNGYETRDELDGNHELKRRLESIRLAIAPKMNLGDVRHKTVPKMTLLSPASQQNSTINTRTFIPHRCHASIGVFGAISVATACALPGSVAYPLARIPGGLKPWLAIEHASGKSHIALHLDADGTITQSAIVLSARKLFDGVVFAHAYPPKQAKR